MLISKVMIYDFKRYIKIEKYYIIRDIIMELRRKNLHLDMIEEK